MDYEYIFRKICERRGVTYLQSESVALSMKLEYGLAEGTELLPTVDGIFYFLPIWGVNVNQAQSTANIYLGVSNLGGASVGGCLLTTTGAVGQNSVWYNTETDFLVYHINGNTGGALTLTGVAFKIYTE